MDNDIIKVDGDARDTGQDGGRDFLETARAELSPKGILV